MKDNNEKNPVMEIIEQIVDLIFTIIMIPIGIIFAVICLITSLF